MQGCCFPTDLPELSREQAARFPKIESVCHFLGIVRLAATAASSFLLAQIDAVGFEIEGALRYSLGL